MRVWADFALERELWRQDITAAAGVDEVGVGALAGPVVAAAVVLGPDTIDGLAVSKLLTPKRREALTHNYLSALRARGLIEGDGDRLKIFQGRRSNARVMGTASHGLRAHRLMAWPVG